MSNMLPAYANRGVYVIEKTINFADELVTKGSALAAADVFDGITIPAKCIRVAAGLTPIVAGDSTTLTLDLGDGDDADSCVDGLNAAQISTDGVPIMTNVKYYPSADTLDVTVATLTGTLTSGNVRVWAVLIDTGAHTS